MGVVGQRPPPAALPPGKTRYPLYSRLSGPHGRSVQVRKILPPLGFDGQTVQTVASRYTDCPIFVNYFFLEINSPQNFRFISRS